MIIQHLKKNSWYILLPMLIASLFKPLGPFYESLDARIVSFIPSNIIALNSPLIILSIFTGGLYLFFSFNSQNFKQVPKLSSSQVLFIFLKLYLICNSLIKNDFGAWLVEDVQSLVIIVFLCFFVQHIGVIRRNTNSILNVAFIVGSVFILINVFEMILNIEAVSFSGRFFGLTVQPNTMGVYSSIFAVISLWKYYKTESRYIKYFTIFIFLLSCFFVFASASRASFAVLLIGLLVFLFPNITWTQLLKAILLVFFSAILMFFIYYDVAIEYFNFSRLIDMTDTRIRTKEIFWSTFFSSPFFGVGNFSESTANSYFVIMVKGGILAISILLCAIFCVLINLYRRMIYIAINDDIRCFTALFIMLSAGGFYEGYLIDNFSFTSVFYLILLGLLSHKNLFIR